MWICIYNDCGRPPTQLHAHQHVLESLVAPPQGLPPRFPIASPAQETPEFRHRMHEVPCRLDPMAQPADHRQFLGRRRRRGRRRTVLASPPPQLDIPTATTDSTPSIGRQRLGRLEPQVLLTAAGLLDLVEILDQGACLPPASGQFRLGLHRQRTEQIRSSGLDPRRRLGSQTRSPTPGSVPSG